MNTRLSVRALALALALSLGMSSPIGPAATSRPALADEATSTQAEIAAQADDAAQADGAAQADASSQTNDATQNDSARTPFAYRHSPLYNPKAMADIVVNPDAVYGFSPNPNSGSLTSYASYDWTDPEVVAQKRKDREEYHARYLQMFKLLVKMQADGATTEQMARAVSALRNELRLASYKDDPEGLANVKAHNLEKYGNENGPTPEILYEKHGSWEAVLDGAFKSNAGMDACCGLYDENWETYAYFGQIPAYEMSFDVAGHGEAPAAQKVYAGEPAARPADPVADGWTFAGWHAEGTAEPYDFSAPVTADTLLVASWTQNPAPTPGTVTSEAKVAEGAPVASASLGSTKVQDLLTEAEAKRVEQGENARVWLEVSASAASDEAKAELLKAARSKAGSTATMAFYTDLALMKQLSGDASATALTEPVSSVTVVLTLDESQIPSNAAQRDWVVVREHDGSYAAIAATFDVQAKTITFTTDRFSSFGVAYGAVKGSSSSGSTSTSSTSVTTRSKTSGNLPKTGDATAAAPLVWLLCAGVVLGAGAAVLRTRDLRKGDAE